MDTFIRMLAEHTIRLRPEFDSWSPRVVIQAANPEVLRLAAFAAATSLEAYIIDNREDLGSGTIPPEVGASIFVLPKPNEQPIRPRAEIGLVPGDCPPNDQVSLLENWYEMVEDLAQGERKTIRLPQIQG